MNRSSSTRDRLLDALEVLLIEQGERAASLDAVAAQAGVSKGGLLYHFESKDALTAGLLGRLSAAVEDDLARMRNAPKGVLDYFIRSSVSSHSPLDRTIVAVVRLAQGSHPQVRDALQHAQSQWFDVVREVVDDPTVARAIMLLSDGIYYNSALLPETNTIVPAGAEMDDLIDLVTKLARTRTAKR